MAKIADAQKLKTLLKYWIEHNQEHSEEFQEWVEKAKSMHELEVSKTIQQAKVSMDKATDYLLKTLKNLSGKEG